MSRGVRTKTFSQIWQLVMNEASERKMRDVEIKIEKWGWGQCSSMVSILASQPSLPRFDSRNYFRGKSIDVAEVN